MAQRNVKKRAIRDVSGEVDIASSNIVKNIKTFNQRVLTAAEKAVHAGKLESKLLAQGVGRLLQSLSVQARRDMKDDSPYKGLLAYSLSEAEIFYGRKEAKKDLLNCLRQGPLAVLYAESGAGKSSLLQAGIGAQLIAKGHLAIYLRPYDADPVDFIKRMFLPELNQAPVLTAAPLRDFLRQVCAVLGQKTNLYLLLDQFEEFFHLLKKGERRPFLKALADCLNDPSLKVRWVLALRAEALSDLAELEPFGIAPFENTYRLNLLSRPEAREAIIEPARRYGINFQQALIDRVLDTLTAHDEVMPTRLQLVCSTLTENLPEDKTLTFASYQDHEGGIAGILHGYLKSQLEHLPVEERILAWKVLQALITADGRRAVKTYSEIMQELKADSVSKEQIDTTLGRLIERRLLFTQPSTRAAYELAHDYLIKEIELDPQVQARKAVQELLDKETRIYQRHRTLLASERLALIEPYQNELRVSTDAEALLSESRKTVRHKQLVSERRRKIILASFLVVAIAMSLLAFWGFRSSQDARQRANIALAHQLASQAQSLNAERNAKQIIAILLATQSMNVFPSGEAAQVLLNNNFAAHSIAGMTHHYVVSSVAFSPDGKYVVSGSFDQTARVWEANTGKEIARLTHDSFVYCVAFSPDGKYVASGSGDFTARVWEASTGKEVARMTHDGDVEAVAFSPNGKYVVSGSYDNTARVWEASTGKEVARMTHDSFVYSVAFSPNGKYVVSGSYDNTARVWEASTGKEVARMTHDDIVRLVSFSPDGRYIVSGGDDYTARVWQALTGKEIARMTHNYVVSSAAFSPDGRYVVSGGYDNTARVWEALTGREVARMTHDSYVVQFVAFSSDGKYVVSGSGDNTARVWEALTGKEIARLTHDSDVSSVAFSPDGKYVVSGSYDHTARVWGVSKGKEVARLTHEDIVQLVAFSPDGKYVASGSYDHTARVWEAMTGKEVARTTHDDIVRIVAFSPDGKYVVSGSYDDTARVWEASTGKEIARLTHDGDVETVAFSPDGKYVVSGSYDDTARVWGASTGKEIARLTHDGDVETVAFSPDGGYVVSGGDDYTARVWEASTGKEVARMTHDDIVRLVAFSPDGRYVVSAGDDYTARVWEASTGKEIARMTHHYLVSSVVFSPDGKYVMSRSEDNTARVWEAFTGKEIARLTHDSDVSSVAFSPDGKYVVSGSLDDTARVWEALTGKEVARLTHDSFVSSVAFSPDGKYVVSGSGDKTARIWMWQPGALISNTCAYLPRNLTRAEWTQYIGDVLPYQAICPNLPIEPAAAVAP